MISKTPEPPYDAVIFASVKADGEMAAERRLRKMLKLAGKPSGMSTETASPFPIGKALKRSKSGSITANAGKRKKEAETSGMLTLPCA
ncbi:hypothetical protein [Bacillus glycinifermentans]|uniref:hypothetical protein n=1 Tax=Bacillus glycinifermentans TaxID=1664069 RepID=UPI000A82491F|nr:hypothetical protein [Bacillus glycinifermentans]